MNDSPGPSEGQPKIIIDDDWKAQARREKEKLAAKEREAAAKAPPSTPKRPGSPSGEQAQGGPESEESGDPTELGFKELVGTFVMQALLYLGAIPDPQSGRAIVSLEHARFNIDMLSVLEQKTKGNLNESEKTELSQALGELRAQFVEVSRAVAQMRAKQAAAAASGGAAGMPGAGGPGQPIAGMPNLRLRNE